MIIVTGAAGFIGSALVGELLRQGWQDIVAVDDFSRADKEPNLAGKTLSAKVDRKDFFTWLDANEKLVQFIFHLGARTDTTEFNTAIFDELNLHYSQRMWEACVKYGIPLVYASSAATYGDGELGYSDQDDTLPYQLKPLNPYGDSKNDFDKWALAQAEKPYFWAGLKFFNVYGPNEYHKGRMASVVFHAFNQITATGGMKLFRSHRPDYKDGEQLRDFPAHPQRPLQPGQWPGAHLPGPGAGHLRGDGQGGAHLLRGHTGRHPGQVPVLHRGRHAEATGHRLHHTVHGPGGWRSRLREQLPQR